MNNPNVVVIMKSLGWAMARIVLMRLNDGTLRFKSLSIVEPPSVEEESYAPAHGIYLEHGDSLNGLKELLDEATAAMVAAELSKPKP